MAGRKMRLLADIYEELDRLSSVNPIDKPADAKLPLELLQMIISKLALRDNIRASVVCKRWLDAAISIRKANKPPLLMFIPKSGDMYEFYDPSQRKSFWLELSQLNGCRVCCAKNSWLLMCNPRNELLFFFQPYTRDIITLPYKGFNSQPIAFSVTPTAPNCIVFTITNVGLMGVAVSTCRPGETEWTTVVHETQFRSFSCRSSTKVVFCNNRFLCFNLPGDMGIYDTVIRGWIVCPVRPPRYPEDRFIHDWSKGKYVVECNGLVFLIVNSPQILPVMCLLEITDKLTWLNVTMDKGYSIFVSYLSSVGRMDLLGTMPGKFHFPKVLLRGKQCVSYCVHKDRYYPSDQSYDWEKQVSSDCVWVEPPESISTFD